MNELDSGFCPVAKIEYTGSSCNVSSCMNFKGGKCSAHYIKSLEENSKEKDILDIFGIDEEELEQSKQRIRESIATNGFFEYLFDKPIVDAKRGEIESLSTKKESYDRWPFKDKPSFERIIYMSTFILTKL